MPDVCTHSGLLSSDQFFRMFGQSARPQYDNTALKRVADAITMEVPELIPNKRLPAGYTYFGQFVAHDLSHTKQGGNARHSTLDLDGMYGQSREELDGLTVTEGGRKRFRIALRGRTREKDLYRPYYDEGDNASDGFAKIPDRRNDIHLIISQLHLAMLEFHAAVHEKLAGSAEFDALDADAKFEKVREVVRCHYQWAIVHDFLRKVCDEALVEKLWGTVEAPAEPSGRGAALLAAMASDGATADSGRDPRLPLEFVLAGFRFGHATVRPFLRSDSRSGYELNDGLPGVPLFNRGFDKATGKRRSLPFRWTLQWDRFLDVTQGKPPQFSRIISPSIAQSLKSLPDFVIEGTCNNETNLALRTLAAGNRARLLTGQEAAEKVNQFYSDLGLNATQPLSPSFGGVDDPLWLYVLREAKERANGQRLGPVGSWIVVTTISMVLQQGPASVSFCGRSPQWRPTLAGEGARFGLADIIQQSGRPVTQEQWLQQVPG